ncbi:MAG: hypothetical protein V9H69_01070 [Anaerolineae bacterium]
MSQADLEIFLFQRSPENYGLTLRFRHPAAGQDKMLPGAAWTLDEAALRQRQHDPAAYGEELAAQLCAAAETRGFLDQALAVAAGQRIPLHLRLFISDEAAALHSLRWETLRLPGSAAPLATGEGVRFSRYLDSDNWRPAAIRPQGSLRALIAVASPDLAGTTLAEVRTADELSAARAGLAGIHAVELASARPGDAAQPAGPAARRLRHPLPGGPRHDRGRRAAGAAGAGRRQSGLDAGRGAGGPGGGSGAAAQPGGAGFLPKRRGRRPMAEPATAARWPGWGRGWPARACRPWWPCRAT